jgi:hypothetical protein
MRTTTLTSALRQSRKKLWEAEEKAKAAGLALNHIMKYQNMGQFRALPLLYHSPQSFQPSALM